MATKHKIGAYSAYAIAVEHGFVGTEEEWLDSLRYDHSEEFQQLAEEVENNKDLAVAASESAAQNARLAQESSQGAKSSEQNASNSADNAASSSQAAVLSAQSAQESADTATTKASEAASSAVSAAASATDAAASADSAAQSAQQAEDAAASVPQIDDAQASSTNLWSGAKTAAELSKKLDANQGAENAGKVLGIGENGTVTPVNGAGGMYELIEDIEVTEDCAELLRTQEPDGTPYNFKAVTIETYGGEGASGNQRVEIGNEAVFLEGVFSAGRYGIIRGITYNGLTFYDFCGSAGTAELSSNNSYRYVAKACTQNVTKIWIRSTVVAGSRIKIYGVRA